MPKRHLVLLMIVTLLISGWSQASMVADHIASMSCRHMAGNAVVEAHRAADTEVTAMPCHHQHHSAAADARHSYGDQGVLPDADSPDANNHFCEDCAGCAAACSASGVIGHISLSGLARQSCLVQSESIKTVSLTLPLPDRPPISS